MNQVIKVLNKAHGAKVIDRKGNFITALIDNEIVRKKVNVFNGQEYVYLLGKYSMAPIFKLSN
jgi:hypothetical protein